MNDDDYDYVGDDEPDEREKGCQGHPVGEEEEDVPGTKQRKRRKKIE